LDTDLGRLYGVTTKRLNEQVKRNRERFPDDFMFQLTMEEADRLRRSRSQIATLKRGQNIKYLPYAFTEHGAIMAANVLNSHRAVQMSVFVVRAFIKMRSILTDTRDLARKLAALEKELKGRLDVHEASIVTVLQRVMDILDPPAVPPPPSPAASASALSLSSTLLPSESGAGLPQSRPWRSALRLSVCRERGGYPLPS